MRNAKKKRDLVDHIFSWSMIDVFNDKLYKQKVKNIPDQFPSVELYLSSYISPLLEETRAELRSKMELVSKAPVCKVVSVKLSKPKELLYNICLEPLRNCSDESGNGIDIANHGDIFALSVAVPSNVADLKQKGSKFLLALVTKNGNGASGPIFQIQAKLSEKIEAPEGKNEYVFAIFLMNTTTNNRIWMALNSGVNRNLNVIKETLSHNSSVGKSCEICSSVQSVQDLDIRLQRVQIDLLISELNESQTGAVFSSLLSSQCNHKHSIQLIWGPPGTGKTKTVSTMLGALLASKSRTLICAPTNVAVVEVASCLQKMVRGSCSPEALCPLGDIVLFGNTERMNISSDLLDIFLDNRVDRLVQCFAQQSGWKHQLASMIQFLEDCIPQYEIYLENEKGKKDKIGGDPIKFREYISNRFVAIAEKLKDCISGLCTHLPSASLPQENFKKLVLALDLLESFKGFLYAVSLGDKKLKKLFQHPGGVGDKETKKLLEISGVNDLFKTRGECLEILRELNVTFKIPHFQEKDLIRDFCIRSATLVFCTTSTSSKLHQLKKQKFQLVVIDEAAQLKECESLIPLQLPGIRHVILVGDEKQLPAMVQSKVSEEAGFGRSLFQRLSSLGQAKHLLNIQYRMHPSISSLPNANFYQNRISDGPNVKHQSHERQYLSEPMYGSYSFINVDSGKEMVGVLHSLHNTVEVAVVLQILRNLFNASAALQRRVTVGVVSPYMAQVVAIQKKLGKRYERHENFVVKVKSIDGFQGGEEDVIIMSTVRSNSKGSVGFLANIQRTNVALTRARHCLWILGNGPTLIDSHSIWKDIVLDAQHRRCFFNADEDESLAEAIVDANIELSQLDDLLHTDSLLFRRARWKALFTAEFIKSFTRIKRTSICKEIIEILQKLANGLHAQKRKVDYVHGSSFQLLKQCNIHGHFLLWTVDIMKFSDYYIQVLKFWDIVPLAAIPNVVKCMDSMFEKYTIDYKLKCKVKCIEGASEVPMRWEICPDVVQTRNLCKSELGKDLLRHLASLNLASEPHDSATQSRVQSSELKDSNKANPVDELSYYLSSLNLEKEQDCSASDSGCSSHSLGSKSGSAQSTNKPLLTNDNWFWMPPSVNHSRTVHGKEVSSQSSLNLAKESSTSATEAWTDGQMAFHYPSSLNMSNKASSSAAQARTDGQMAFHHPSSLNMSNKASSSAEQARTDGQMAFHHPSSLNMSNKASSSAEQARTDGQMAFHHPSSLNMSNKASSSAEQARTDGQMAFHHPSSLNMSNKASSSAEQARTDGQMAFHHPSSLNMSNKASSSAEQARTDGQMAFHHPSSLNMSNKASSSAAQARWRGDFR